MTAALERGEWSAARPGLLYPREKPGTHCAGGWVGLRADLDGAENLAPPEFDPRTVLSIAQSLYRLNYPVHKTATVLVATDNLRCRLLRLIRRKSSTKTNLTSSVIKRKKRLVFSLILLVRLI